MYIENLCKSVFLYNDIYYVIIFYINLIFCNKFFNLKVLFFKIKECNIVKLYELWNYLNIFLLCLIFLKIFCVCI